MNEQYEEKAFEFLKDFKRITPLFLMRKLKISYECSILICQKIWLRQHLEAMKLAKEIDMH